jgi:hypothetical protein
MNSLYFIDWPNVTSVNDLFLIIASMGLSFSPHHPGWDNIKHLMDYSNPVALPQQQPTQKAEAPKFEKMELPKLKTVK